MYKFGCFYTTFIKNLNLCLKTKRIWRFKKHSTLVSCAKILRQNVTLCTALPLPFTGGEEVGRAAMGLRDWWGRCNDEQPTLRAEPALFWLGWPWWSQFLGGPLLSFCVFGVCWVGWAPSPVDSGCVGGRGGVCSGGVSLLGLVVSRQGGVGLQGQINL